MPLSSRRLRPGPVGGSSGALVRKLAAVKSAVPIERVVDGVRRIFVVVDARGDAAIQHAGIGEVIDARNERLVAEIEAALAPGGGRRTAAVHVNQTYSRH